MSGNIQTRSQYLKLEILDRQRATAPASMLNCAAHMLLQFDDDRAVHRIALQFLLERFDATRASLGFGTPEMPLYSPSATEKASDIFVPSVERPISNGELSIQRVWRSPGPVSFDLHSDIRLERLWAATETKAKLAQRIQAGDRIYGIVCIDDTIAQRQWKPSDTEYLDKFVRCFLAPILASLREQSNCKQPMLTRAEAEVVRLAIHGLRYKEIAAVLAKSPNTVDNQLRKIRSKLRVRNQVELVKVCSGLLNV